MVRYQHAAQGYVHFAVVFAQNQEFVSFDPGDQGRKKPILFDELDHPTRFDHLGWLPWTKFNPIMIPTYRDHCQ
jgi:hypothetical protein